MRKLTQLLLFLTALPVLMAADVYRWVDRDGVVNYTQQKPEGVNAVLISSSGRVRGEPSSATAVESVTPPAASDSQLSPEQQTMLDELQAAEAKRKEAFTAARADNCKRAQAALEQLSINGRVRVRDADGNQTILGEDERQQRIAKAQEGVAENCSPL